jgi:hypothetical protein
MAAALDGGRTLWQRCPSRDTRIETADARGRGAGASLETLCGRGAGASLETLCGRGAGASLQWQRRQPPDTRKLQYYVAATASIHCPYVAAPASIHCAYVTEAALCGLTVTAVPQCVTAVRADCGGA